MGRVESVLRFGYGKIKRAMSGISPLLASKMMFRISHGKKLDLNHPVDFNEKLMWLKFNTYNHNPIITQCSDKYRVRDYIRDQGYPELLNELYAVADDPEEIDWGMLPDQFVVKCNHGCGMNLICADRSVFDIQEAKRTLRKWLKDDYWKNAAEIQYRDIPKKIIVEEYLSSKGGLLPNDYKFYCFNGEPKIVMACYDRGVSEEEVKFMFLDMDWNVMDIGAETDFDMSTHPRPISMDKMIDYCRVLSKKFPFVRLDFYEIDGKPILGEMTFIPSGGFISTKIITQEGLNHMGNLLDLSGEMTL